MKILQKQFTKKGFLHTQLDRDGDIAIFSRQKGNALEHFEVVKIGRHHGYELAGNHIPAAETYPSSSTWGVNGFTYLDRQEAKEKFHALVSARDAE